MKAAQVSTGAAAPISAWQRERIQRLCRIFRCVDGRIARGQTMHKALVWFAWRWKNRSYKHAPGQRIHFGYGTLRALYSRWKASGRRPDSLIQHYRVRGQGVGLATVRAQAEAALAPGCQSFRAAFKCLKQPLGSESAYRYATPEPLRRALSS